MPNVDLSIARIDRVHTNLSQLGSLLGALISEESLKEMPAHTIAGCVWLASDLVERIESDLMPLSEIPPKKGAA